MSTGRHRAWSAKPRHDRRGRKNRTPGAMDLDCVRAIRFAGLTVAAIVRPAADVATHSVGLHRSSDICCQRGRRGKRVFAGVSRVRVWRMDVPSVVIVSAFGDEGAGYLSTSWLRWFSSERCFRSAWLFQDTGETTNETRETLGAENLHFCCLGAAA